MTTDEERWDGRLSLGTQLGHWANTEYTVSSETSLQEDEDYVEFSNLTGQMVLIQIVPGVIQTTGLC